LAVLAGDHEVVAPGLLSVGGAVAEPVTVTGGGDDEVVAAHDRQGNSRVAFEVADLLAGTESVNA
jgi:hypothetical protein